MILSLFFTRGISLELWVKQGLFYREKLIYEKHLEQGNLDRVYWFTYGSRDEKIAEELKEKNELHRLIEVYEMPKVFANSRIGSYLYSVILPFYYRKRIQRSVIIKTNQMDGSWTGVIAHVFFRRKLIVRTGYTPSQLESSKNRNSLRLKWYRFIERLSYKHCDIAIVASQHNKKYLLDNRYLEQNKIKVIKNFVDIETFKPLLLERYNDRILFVGRLNREKNLHSLIEAVGKTSLTLDIYGTGNLEQELMSFAKEMNAKVNFMGVVGNSQLASIYNRYQYYILPSFFEGMPKTLLEAMACGCVCIGTNVPGINEVIEDQVDGLLCDDVCATAISNKLHRLGDENTKILSIKAVWKIERFYSLEHTVYLDLEIINNL
ncbi:glycosyltransferase [Vibrio sp. DW001]|uniref:glycosyltransferase n=1 Tax=Vibrio sp. DW001 TaxID=2912315 RepID=UPI0023AF2AFB|nr:glycosyltransferase [Vibrio sp. DW001]WED26881.1 glycosyltransferase [Vibrio sp. DW001]